MNEQTQTAAQKKAAQRAKWRSEGWTEITVRVAKEHAEEARRLVSELPAPTAPEHPDQQKLPFEI
jgi:hypothetical protein|tara:strand:+ start:944 stop:1138 length:195 start_codon:yes stop_codon:yes gene_type:complete